MERYWILWFLRKGKDIHYSIKLLQDIQVNINLFEQFASKTQSNKIEVFQEKITKVYLAYYLLLYIRQ